MAEVTVPAVQDPNRLAAVLATRLLDTGPEEAFDRLARLAGILLQVPYAFVTVVDGSRSFWKSCIGVSTSSLAERQNTVEESFCQYVVNTDEPLVVGDARLNEVTRANPSIEKMGVVAWAGYPLRSIDGHVLGTFCVVDTAVRDWTNEDIEILAALSAAVEGEMRLRTLLDHNAVAAENTRREMLVRERLAKLAELLTAADTIDAVSASIIELGPAVLGATLATVGLVDEARMHLQIRGPVADDEALGSTYSIVSLTDSLPIVDAVRTEEAIFIHDRNDFAKHYPHLIPVIGALGLAASASIPLLHSDGRVLGALTVGWPSTSAFTVNDRALLRTVSLMCAQSLERALLGDLRRQFVESLQHELLPANPRVLGLDAAVRYIPANTGIGFGGDWYDVIGLDDGRAIVVVGDVAGHGIEAAARMAQVRGAINALTRMYADDLSNVFVEAESMLRSLQDRYIATLVIFVIDPETGTIEYVSAGHPPAVVVTATGESTLLTGGVRPLLGSGQGPAESASAVLPAGAVLVAFTDGLVERRDQSTDAGTDRLISLVEQAAAEPGDAAFDPEQLADRLVQDLIGERSVSDDVALVVIRRHR